MSEEVLRGAVQAGQRLVDAIERNKEYFTHAPFEVLDTLGAFKTALAATSVTSRAMAQFEDLRAGQSRSEP